jgi:3-isopropylmalate dehydrogenase
MLDFLGEKKAADLIERAIIRALDSGEISSLSAGRMGMGTDEVGDLIAKYVREGN